MEITMIKLPDECSNTLEHVLVHLNSAYDSSVLDPDQVKYDIGIAEGIIKNIMERDKIDR